MSSSYSIWGAFAETPWWIYMFFIWLLFISWQTTKPQTLPSKAVIVFPVALLILLYMLMPIVLPMNLKNFFVSGYVYYSWIAAWLSSILFSGN
jgi:hypothetical protein